ncbi:MAG TPA: hypothetical protein ENN79_02075 [Desulfobacteraceae bacterium]|nr:hypothetical protein [Desulfobacteraceae bacterium]
MIISGVERRKIFRSDDDRLNFLNRGSVLVPETTTEWFVWAIPANSILLAQAEGFSITTPH